MVYSLAKYSQVLWQYSASIAVYVQVLSPYLKNVITCKWITRGYCHTICKFWSNSMAYFNTMCTLVFGRFFSAPITVQRLCKLPGAVASFFSFLGIYGQIAVDFVVVSSFACEVIWMNWKMPFFAATMNKGMQNMRSEGAPIAGYSMRLRNRLKTVWKGELYLLSMWSEGLLTLKGQED